MITLFNSERNTRNKQISVYFTVKNNEVQKGEYISVVSEKKKASNAKWDKENMCTLGVRLRRDKAERFKWWCKLHGTTPNAEFKKIVDKALSEYDGKDL